MKREAYIFGAGFMGKCANLYFEDKLEIKGFIDNNENLWGKKVYGKYVYQPDVLKKNNDILIIVPNNKEEIERQLKTDYEVKNIIFFDARFSYDTFYREMAADGNDEVIVYLHGGLGNQMFHYALYRYITELGVQASLDDSPLMLVFSDTGRSFELPHVFDKAKIRLCNKAKRKKYQAEGLYQKEKCLYNFYDYRFDKGIIDGNQQIHNYADSIRGILLKEFVFPKCNDIKYRNLKDRISRSNSVSIHVRRGDYVEQSDKYYDVYSMGFYDRAISIINEKVDNPEYYVFSNDIEWSRNNLYIKNAVYINGEEFENYEDWMDMQLMSLCKSNIIANSTFSWWGAWLNRNEGKTVIAPSTWIKGCETTDLFPEDWVVI